MLSSKERKLIILSLLVVSLIFLAARGFIASTSPNFTISADIFDSGGGKSSSPNFILSDGIGQPMPVGNSASSNFRIIAGKGASILFNIPPVAVADGPDLKVIVGEVADFDGSDSYDLDGSIALYQWDFGDGSPVESGVAVSHTYSATNSYNVTLTVTDDGGAINIDTIVVEVITATGAIDDLVDIIDGMGLHQGTENSLMAKLEGAKDALERGQPNVAINKLGSFINEVEAQRGKKLTDEQADLLIEYANRIISVLSGSPAPAVAIVIPSEPLLSQNYPNPFNPDTWIPYQLPKDADVTIRIYNVSGQLVRTLELGHKPAGFYLNRSKAAYWDGRNEVSENVASGIYFYSIQAGKYTSMRKMLMLK